MNFTSDKARNTTLNYWRCVLRKGDKMRHLLKCLPVIALLFLPTLANACVTVDSVDAKIKNIALVQGDKLIVKREKFPDGSSSLLYFIKLKDGGQVAAKLWVFVHGCYYSGPFDVDVDKAAQKFLGRKGADLFPVEYKI